MGVTLAGIGTVWRTTQQRFKENQLLFVGKQFSRAITAYYLNSPGGVQQFPKKLEDLILDKRYPTATRYLRKIFADPVTGNNQWGLIKAADGSIVGVHSLSDLAPIKTDNFGKGFEKFAQKKHYSEWQFTYNTVVVTPPAAPATLPKPVVTPYTVAPPQPLPPSPTPEQTRQHLCDVMHNNDANICSAQATQFGDTVGAACMASANQRYAICTGSDNAPLPSLNVLYK